MSDAQNSNGGNRKPKVQWRGVTSSSNPSAEPTQPNSLRVDLGPLPFDEGLRAQFNAEAAEESVQERFPPLPFDELPEPEKEIEPTPYAERFPPLPDDFEMAAQAIEAEEAQAALRVKEIKPALADRPRRRSRFGWQDLVALLFIALTGAAIYIGLAIFRNPYTEWNPLPPPTPLPIFITTTPLPPTPELLLGGPITTPTPEPAILESTLESTNVPTHEPTSGPTATFTPLPADVLTQLAPTPEVLASEEPGNFG